MEGGQERQEYMTRRRNGKKRLDGGRRREVRVYDKEEEWKKETRWRGEKRGKSI
jgi:hypothetical protein